jgi:diaminopropionate ammonia-lyase
LFSKDLIFMIKVLKNPYINIGLQQPGVPEISLDVEAVNALLKYCPKALKTPLVSEPSLAKEMGVSSMWFKDERNRMGLGSFKALGAAFVIAQEAAIIKNKNSTDTEWSKTLSGRVFVSASAGNHGLSIVAGAKVFGAKAVIYLSTAVPTSFGDRLRTYGAKVFISGETYEESMDAAIDAAQTNGWTLLSDSTWEGNYGGVNVMQGYLVAAQEACEACPETPTHVFLQAGVGGFAAAMAGYIRKFFKDPPQIIIVEPEIAAALLEAVKAGHLIDVGGGASSMGRLDCKIASLVALESLTKTSNYFVTLTDMEVEEMLPILSKYSLDTSPSGGAGFAAAYLSRKEGLFNLGNDSKILTFLSEGSIKT